MEMVSKSFGRPYRLPSGPTHRSARPGWKLLVLTPSLARVASRGTSCPWVMNSGYFDRWFVNTSGAVPATKLVVMFVPVSYTHLRAHETVLDLVCRLLLEKKKNK